VNYHTLADFRVEKQEELDELFTQVLAALSKEGVITLEQVTQDGTKIKALASRRSYHQEETIREHLEQARQRVEAMGDPRNDEGSPKAKQAQARARRQQQERLESALEELQKLQARKAGDQMHALMTPILLRMAGLDALNTNPPGGATTPRACSS